MQLNRLSIAVPLLMLRLAMPHCRAADDRQPIDVWLDVDTSTGITDVDDGLALIQAFHSPELNIRGVSTVFGNAALPEATRIAREIVSRFGPPGLIVQPGADSAAALGAETDATRALAQQLAKHPLTILALGPVTNVATLVKRHPDLQERIRRIVMVAARRPGQRFISSDDQKVPHRDFNFEQDADAMQFLLRSQVPLVFAPWEVSSQVWITRDDLNQLKATGGSGAWIAETSADWIALWERSISKRGFNPFDTLAVGWLTHPKLVESTTVRVWIESAADDRDPRQKKFYLLADPGHETGRAAVYCHTPVAGFKAMLLARLAGQSP